MVRVFIEVDESIMWVLGRVRSFVRSLNLVWVNYRLWYFCCVFRNWVFRVRFFLGLGLGDS